MAEEQINYKKYPDKFRELLYNFASDTYQCVSKNETDTHMLSVYKMVTQTATERTKVAIDYFFETSKLEQRISKLIELEKNAKTKENAWRPTTGIAETEAVHALALMLKAKRLEKLINQGNQEVQMLETLVTEQRNQLISFCHELEEN